MDWLEEAQKLPLNSHERYKHCGKDAAANIYHNEEGYSIKCFRCGMPDEQTFVSHGYRNYKELLKVKARNREAQEELTTSVLKLPKNFTQDIPPMGMRWLLKASITPYMAKEAGFGYDTYFERVILPVFEDDKLVFFQARAIKPGQVPKYLNPKVNRERLLYTQQGTTHLDTVVVTEDILSAHRVHAATGIATASLLGTSITVQQANRLTRFTNITTWLDPDAAGEHGAQAVAKLAGLVSNVSNLISDKDPKNYPDKQIRQLLWTHLNKTSHT